MGWGIVHRGGRKPRKKLSTFNARVGKELGIMKKKVQVRRDLLIPHVAKGDAPPPVLRGPLTGRCRVATVRVPNCDAATARRHVTRMKCS